MYDHARCLSTAWLAGVARLDAGRGVKARSDQMKISDRNECIQNNGNALQVCSNESRAEACARRIPRFWNTLPLWLKPSWAGGISESGFLAQVAVWLHTEQERRRFFLWLPVAYGAGIVLYFMAAAEPHWWESAIGVGLFAAVAVALRRRGTAAGIALLVAMVFGGVLAGSVRTLVVAQPILTRVVVGTLTGRVLTVDERPQGPRAVIAVSEFSTASAKDFPRYVRLSFRKDAVLVPGMMIQMTARLMPPPAPARPGGYDFARDAFFNGLGAVGSVNGALRHVEAPPAEFSHDSVSLDFVSWDRPISRIDQARIVLSQRIIAAAKGQEGAFIAALVTGKRGMITEETNASLRAAGIYHVVSIGGFHMTLVAGAIFLLARAVMATVPVLALRYPIKKAAAVVGMAGATAYCIFSGAGIDTMRALFVTVIVMSAILADRPVLSMRNLALAAMICLTLQPETLLGPSFQMSFAGVAALIALYEKYDQRIFPGPLTPWGDIGSNLDTDAAQGDEGKPGPLFRTGRMVIAGIITTIVATLATAPFSTFHFQTFNPYGVLGNMFGLPLVELVIMPLSLLAVVLYPVGLDAPVWMLAGLAASLLLEGARVIEQLSGSVLIMPAFGWPVLASLVVGLLWLCLWSTPIRWLGVLPASIGAVAAFTVQLPDIRIDREGRGAAIRNSVGQILIIGRPSAFVIEQWLRADGDLRNADDSSLKDGVRCDPAGCVGQLPNGAILAVSLKKEAVREDCRKADILISRWAVPRTCEARHVIDADDLAHYGAVNIDLAEGAFVLTAANSPSASRPWRHQPPPLKGRFQAEPVPAMRDISSAEPD